MIAVIGAGAAGLAAARTLHDAGQQVVIFEARDRIGGRTWTDDTFADFPIELGAEFIHGEKALTNSLVEAAGMTTIPVVRMKNLRWSDGNSAALPVDKLPEKLRETIHALLSSYNALLEAMPTTDVSLAQALAAQGYDQQALEIADVLLAQTCCARLDGLSLADMAREAAVDHAGKDEFRIHEGYGALFADYSRDLTIRLNTVIDVVHWSEAGVRLIGQNLDNEATVFSRCIITVPVPVLAAGRIIFDPPLSEDKQAAIRAFRTEAATKLMYRFQKQLWDADLTYMAHEGIAARWWTPGYGREDAAVICAYITADRACEVDSLPLAEAEAFGLRELALLLGLPVEELQKQQVDFRRLSWADDPFASGGYAHLPPGFADARPALAASEGNILFFAGEATAYDSNPQTVHGALESGIRAAQECLNSL